MSIERLAQNFLKFRKTTPFHFYSLKAGPWTSHGWPKGLTATNTNDFTNELVHIKSHPTCSNIA